MASEDDLCRDYLLLKPEEASFLDLVRVLCCSEWEKRGFIECTEEKELMRERRWIIFISLLVQKMLLYLRKPLAITGSVVELWLNLLSSNGGFLALLLNLLKGKMAVPDKSSAEFTSVLGNLDTRVDLDRSIKNDDRRYSLSLSIMAAKLSYENEDFVQSVVRYHWKMEFLTFYNFWNEYQKKFSTQAFMFRHTSSGTALIVVAFRGTEPFDADAWRTDFDISWYKLPNVGKIHGGFMKALGQQKRIGWPKEIEQGNDSSLLAYYTIRQQLREILHKDEKAKFIVTGHSLGGALAILFVAILAYHEESWLMEKLEGVYTFGQPRVGDEQFGKFMEEKFRTHNVRYLRCVYCNDMVVRLPYDDRILLFKHFGTCLYFNSCYRGEVVREEPNKNYFSVVWAIPKILNAVWELIRSFIIPYIKGPDYREGWFQRLLRVVGLVIPGLSDHGPQDYVNATRLGSLPLTPQL
ncbi:hypothetical protein CK203_024738 [Vitis vinifera]|uniref:Fungal lipase-type domain-containing protein n=1 Tax=Vitis vinifera TaxID=29760 RepID=A0A438ITJ0_VITVI|nr:hypothetical protein CK203_024738 [Vitis vinifera]